MICKVRDIDIYYETYGEGKPILMIHGYGIDHNVMVGCMEPIFKSRPGYRRIYFDLPGMGLSKTADWLNSSDQILDIIVKFCDQVIPGENFLVSGESYGGYLARGLVYKEPQRLDGVLLICPVVIAEKSKRELPPRKVFVRDEQMLAGIEPISRKFFERMLVLQDERRWKRFQQDILPGMRSKDTDFTRRLMGGSYAFSFDVDRLERPFEKPSLVLAGRQDASVGFKDALRIIDDYPRGTFAVLDRAGHGLEVEQECLFNSLAGEWLDRVEEDARLNEEH
jgi:pimeloyl-ACP methyl ester carboxylesterase